MEGAAAPKTTEQKKPTEEAAPLTSYVTLFCKECGSINVHTNVAKPMRDICEKCKGKMIWIGWLAMRPGVHFDIKEEEKPKESEAPQAAAPSA
jgi:hypothetical protein